MEIYSDINSIMVPALFECSLFAFACNIWTVPDIKDSNPPFVLSSSDHGAETTLSQIMFPRKLTPT